MLEPHLEGALEQRLAPARRRLRRSGVWMQRRCIGAHLEEFSVSGSSQAVFNALIFFVPARKALTSVQWAT